MNRLEERHPYTFSASLIKALALEHTSQTRLMAAVRRDDVATVSALLAEGERFDKVGGEAAILLAIEQQSPRLLRVLMDTGTPIPDIALCHAFTYDHLPEIVDLLIPRISAVALADSVYIAIVCRTSLRVLDQLLDAGAPCDGVNGRHPLTEATTSHIPYLELLLRRGADPFVPADRTARGTRERVLQQAQAKSLEEKRRTQIACFVACYRPAAYQGTIPDELVHPLAPLVWPQGCGGIRRRVVAYLVDDYADRIQYNNLRHLLFMQGF
jgi:hypothetical protein